MTSVGVLGIGRMGSSMARALAAAGFDLLLWNRSAAPAEALAAELGGTTRVVARPRDVAAAADVCVTMLADGRAIDAVYGGPDGLVAGARPGLVIIDSSTVPPAALRTHAAAIRAAGAGVLDAPVSGSVALATSGKLTLMVGGEPADIERARPVLDALGTTIFHLGPLGTGAAMKLAVNTVIFGLNQAVAEGLVLAEAAGIERATAYDVLAASAVGAPYVAYKRAAFVDPDETPVAFALELAAKDLGLIGELADAVDVPIPQARTDLEVINAAIAEGAGRDFSAVAEHLRRARGTEEGATDR
jgi:3-hydroxyisobutyrate dehydrogenase-like beta-hydroxyacid dehydrogenase